MGLFYDNNVNIMKIRQYPGRATAIGSSGMEFQYEASWQEVNKKWGLEDRVKRNVVETMSLPPPPAIPAPPTPTPNPVVKDISKIGVKLPGLTSRVRTDSWVSDHGDRLKFGPDIQLKPFVPHEQQDKSSSASGSENGSHDTTTKRSVVPVCNGHELKRGLKEMMEEAMEAENPNSKVYRELEKRYQIYTAQNLNGIEMPVRKPTSILKNSETTSNEWNSVRVNPVKRSESCKQVNGSVGAVDRIGYRDKRELIRQLSEASGRTSSNRLLTKQLVVQDEPKKMNKAPVSDNHNGSIKIQRVSSTLTAKGENNFPLVPNQADSSSLPPRNHTTQTRPRQLNPTVTFRNEPPTIIPKSKEIFDDDLTTTTSTSFDYADFRSPSPHSDDSNLSDKSREERDSSFRSNRLPQQRNEEASRLKKQAVETARHNGHGQMNRYDDSDEYTVDDDDEHWTVEDDDDETVYDDSGESSRSVRRMDRKVFRSEYLVEPSSLKANDKPGGKVKSSDSLKESFRIARDDINVKDTNSKNDTEFIQPKKDSFRRVNKGVLQRYVEQKQQKSPPTERTTTTATSASEAADTSYRIRPLRISPEAVVESVVSASDPQDSEFIIPRPKLIVPVHTYGIRKRRTGNMLHSSRRGSDADTVLSGTSANDKKHHTSCPGKCHHPCNITCF